jgi:hypothetical protein
LADIDLQFVATIRLAAVLHALGAAITGRAIDQPWCRYCWSTSYNVFLWQIRQNQKMNSIFPIFTFAILAGFGHDLLAQQRGVPGNSRIPPVPVVARAERDSNSGDALLRRAIGAVDAERSISAKVRHKVDLLSRQVIGSGVYLQQGRGPQRQLRLELNLVAPSYTSSMLQVCDGATLWIQEDLTDRKNLSRVDVTRLRRARPKSPSPGLDASAWLALGGLPKLLMGFEKSFRFDPPSESRLDALRVWTVEGHWKPAKLAELLPDQKAAIEAGQMADTRNLAPNMPDCVVLHLGCDDLFPYRIEYWRSAPADKGRGGNRGTLLAVLELFEVRLGGPIDPRQFAYQVRPDGVQPADRTQAFLDMFGLEEIAPSGAQRIPPPRR